ncbi:MAG: GerAB/ArcD/ProY family transporter [Firmicutes bacterium]|nr:GerAB/ArcD/ProY family transporter [Bacillota bacterium]
MKDNISSAQWIAVLASSVSAILMMNYIRLFVSEVGRGTYISALLLALLTGIFILILIDLEKANDFRSPLETSMFLMGKAPAYCICILTALAFYLFTVETLNIYVYIVKFYFLPRTPTPILAFVLFLPAAYIAFCGFRTFGSMASITLLAFILFLLMFFFTKNNYLPSNLMPWNDFQWSNVLSSLPGLFLSAPAIAASFFILPYCTDHKHIKRKAVFFSLGFGALMIFLYFAGMAYFGEHIIQKLILPFYNLSPFFKGNLLERFDIIYMLALLPTLGIFNAFAFSVCSLIGKELFPSESTKHPGRWIILFSVSAVLLSSLTVNRVPLWQIYQYCNITSLILFGIFALIYGTAAVKRRTML